MTYYDLPSDLRGNLLESREKFPLYWTAPSEDRAEEVHFQLCRVIHEGGMEPVLSVSILEGLTVSVERIDS